ncbi:MAG: hypothetical protein WC072_09455 [Methanoregulaceae archaeon]|jgi:hypothetical protein
MADPINSDHHNPLLPISARKMISVATKIGLEQARARGKLIGRRRVEIETSERK